MGNPVVHFEIMGQHAKNLQTFYAKAFDWEINQIPGEMEYYLVKTGGQGAVGGGIGQSEKGQPNAVTFYIGVDDPQKQLDKIEQLGGKTVMPVTVIPDMVTLALFADPDGNVVGLVKNEPK